MIISRRTILAFLGVAISESTLLARTRGYFGHYSPQGSSTLVPKCTPQTCYSVVEPPGYDVPGMTRIYNVRTWKSHVSLLERTRSLTHILGQENLLDLVHEKLLDAAIEAKIGDLLPLIGERILPGKTGYLLRINLVVDPTRGKPLASPNFIEAVGAGREPLDALAESYQIGSITARQPDLPKIRKYFWCSHQGEDLRISCANEVLSEELETQARKEATRRHVLGVSSFNLTEVFDLIKQAETWREFGRERMRLVQNDADRILIEHLNLQFEASQQRFNAAYAAYQLAKSNLAANAREMALISQVSTLMDSLRVGLSAVNGLGSGETQGYDVKMRWRKHQSEVLETATKNWLNELNLNLPALRTLDEKLREEWTRLGVPSTPAAFTVPQLH